MKTGFTNITISPTIRIFPNGFSQHSLEIYILKFYFIIQAFQLKLKDLGLMAISTVVRIVVFFLPRIKDKSFHNHWTWVHYHELRKNFSLYNTCARTQEKPFHNIFALSVKVYHW